jgi:hypothetical protein
MREDDFKECLLEIIKEYNLFDQIPLFGFVELAYIDTNKSAWTEQLQKFIIDELTTQTLPTNIRELKDKFGNTIFHNLAIKCNNLSTSLDITLYLDLFNNILAKDQSVFKLENSEGWRVIDILSCIFKRKETETDPDASIIPLEEASKEYYENRINIVYNYYKKLSDEGISIPNFNKYLIIITRIHIKLYFSEFKITNKLLDVINKLIGTNNLINEDWSIRIREFNIYQYSKYNTELINEDFNFADPSFKYPIDKKAIKYLNPNPDPEYYNKQIINKLMNENFPDSSQIGGINNYKNKYMKYKAKYLKLKNIINYNC